MKSFIVIGLGRFGGAVARKLCELGHEVLAVDKVEQNVERVTDAVTHAIIADATEERTLKALGVRNYDCAIVAIGEELSASVLIALGLKELGVKQVICKARDLQHKKILEQIGADRVIIPEHESGSKLALQLVQRNLIDSLELSETFHISEITVPARWVGKRIGQVDVRRKHGCTVAAIKKTQADDEIIVAPGPDDTFTEGDILVLLGDTEAIRELGRL